MNALAIKKHLYWLFLAIFGLHQVLQYILEIYIPFADSYLDPFLAPPVILGAWQAERVFIFKYNLPTRLHFIEVAAVTLYIAIIGEYLFPFLSSRFYFDPWDFPAYLMGGWVFHRFLND
jgi:hypothetical protein